jgi:hypothetical protein
MTTSIVKQSDLPVGYGFIQTQLYHLGTGVVRYIVLKANQHPRVQLITTPTVGGDANAGTSGAYCINTTGGAGAHWTCEHSDGRNAATTLGVDTDNNFYPWTLDTTKDNNIFEADEDIIMLAHTAAANGADCSLVCCSFQVMSSDWEKGGNERKEMGLKVKQSELFTGYTTINVTFFHLSKKLIQ